MKKKMIFASILAVCVIAPVGPGQTKTPRQNNPIEIEVVTITRFGFEPPSITRPKGKFILSVENRSRLDVSARFGSELNGALAAELKAIPLAHDHPDFHDVFDLVPGSFILVEDAHPAWKCKITIKP
jgi:hypothetical protein